MGATHIIEAKDIQIFLEHMERDWTVDAHLTVNFIFEHIMKAHSNVLRSWNCTAYTIYDFNLTVNSEGTATWRFCEYFTGSDRG